MKKNSLLLLERTKELEKQLDKFKFSVLDGKVYKRNDKLMVLFENNLNFFSKRMKLLSKFRPGFSGYSKFMQKEDLMIIRKYIPTIFLVVTPICNSECRLCFMKGRDIGWMSLDDVSILMKLIGRKKKVIVWGLEPTLHPRIFDIIKIIRKSGNYPEIYTNGLMLSSRIFVSKLKESGVLKVNITFDGFRPEVHELLRGNREFFEKKLMALKNLEKEKIDTLLSATIAYGINEDQMVPLINYSLSRQFIKGVSMFAATYSRKFDLDLKEFLTGSDLVEMFSSFYDIDPEYFFEFERLRANLNQLFLKFLGHSFPARLFAAPIIFKREKNSLREIVRAKELSKINEEIEKGNLRKVLTLKRYFRFSFVDLFKLVKDLNGFHYELLKKRKDLFYVTLGKISTEFNFLPIITDSAEIRKDKKGNFIITYGSAPT